MTLNRNMLVANVPFLKSLTWHHILTPSSLKNICFLSNKKHIYISCDFNCFVEIVRKHLFEASKCTICVIWKQFTISRASLLFINGTQSKWYKIFKILSFYRIQLIFYEKEIDTSKWKWKLTRIFGNFTTHICFMCYEYIEMFPNFV